MKKISVIMLFAFLHPVAANGADVLQLVEKNGKINVGYRTDAPPFSFRNDIGEPAGYTVDLCRNVAALIGQRLKKTVSVVYVPVTAKNRFEAVQAGKVDLLCGATTERLSRRKIVNFSVATFVTGASVIYRADGPGNFAELAGHKIGVTGGTTTEQDLADTLKQLGIKAEVVQFSNHDDGLKGLKSGRIDAYFGDRVILMALMRKSQDSLVGLRLSDRHFSVEPYALAMPIGADRFRDEVDRALSQIYQSGVLWNIFRNSFGDREPSTYLKALTVINALSD